MSLCIVCLIFDDLQKLGLGQNNLEHFQLAIPQYQKIQNWD